MWSGIWFVARARIGFSTWILPMRQCELGQEVVCWFQCWKNSTYFIWPVLIMLVLLMWKWMGLFLRKKSSWCWGWLSLPNWIGFLTLSLLLKLPPRILEPWFVLRIFPSPEFTLYLGKSTIRPCMEYCCCIWAGAPSCCLDLLYKLQKQICKIVGPLLAASPEPLTHCWNAAGLSLFYLHTLVDVYLNWLNWFHSLILEGGLLIILMDCMIFSHHFYMLQGCLYQQFLSSHS